MKKLLKSGICGSVNSARMHYSLWKSQHLRLLFNEHCMNSSRITPETHEKKKKKRMKREAANADIASVQSKPALRNMSLAF